MSCGNQFMEHRCSYDCAINEIEELQATVKRLNSVLEECSSILLSFKAHGEQWGKANLKEGSAGHEAIVAVLKRVKKVMDE